MTTAPDPTLVRALGRRDLTAFAINRVIGAGIFGIPAVLYAGVGPLSILAILLAGLVVLCITLCFAEVGSRFRDTGGPYLYAHDTFGPVVGFEVGWLMWVTQLGGFAAVTNLFVNYVGWFVPAVTAGPWRIAIITALVAVLTIVNVLGVRRAAAVNNILTLAKLVPLALFVLVGVFYVDGSLLVPHGAADGRRPLRRRAARDLRLQRIRGPRRAERRGAGPRADHPLRAAGRPGHRRDHLHGSAGGGGRDAARSRQFGPTRLPTPPSGRSEGRGPS